MCCPEPALGTSPWLTLGVLVIVSPTAGSLPELQVPLVPRPFSSRCAGTGHLCWPAGSSAPPPLPQGGSPVPAQSWQPLPQAAGARITKPFRWGQGSKCQNSDIH